MVQNLCINPNTLNSYFDHEIIVHHQIFHLGWFQWSTTFLILICGKYINGQVWPTSNGYVPIRKWFFLQHLVITVIVTKFVKVNEPKSTTWNLLGILDLVCPSLFKVNWRASWLSRIIWLVKKKVTSLIFSN